MSKQLEARFERRALGRGTRRTYRFAVEHVEGAETIDQLARQVQAVCNGKPVGTVSVRKAAAMHYAAAYLKDEGGIGALKNKLAEEVKIKPRRNAEVVGLDDEQLKALFSAPLPEDIKLCFRLMLVCGLRSGEARELPWDAMSKRQLLIKGKGDKDRFVPVGEPTWSTLVERRKSARSEWVFPGRFAGPLTESGLWNHVRVLRKTDALCDFHPHRLRHNYAENQLDRGKSLKEIQELLGHASINTTAVYARASKKKLAASADLAEDFMREIERKK